MTYALVGDCRAIPLLDESVDAVVTDPPYGLAFMGKAWDHDVPGPDYWREVYRVMKPGAHLLAFGGTRTWHWLTVGIEEAGFEIRDCLSWMYGTGFPKSHDISKAIDKAAGADREVVGTKRGTKASPETGRSDMPGKATGVKQVGTEVDVTAPATEPAERWDGFGTALKPAWEPIVLAMKPTDGTFAENALEHGVAGLNVDGCRIGVEDTRRAGTTEPTGDLERYRTGKDNRMTGSENGRWPANVTLSHTRWCRRRGTKEVRSGVSGPKSKGSFEAPSVLTDGEDLGADEKGTERGYGPVEETEDWDCPPSCPVRMLDEQSGERRSAGCYPSDASGRGVFGDRTQGDLYDDTGGASRFYYCAKASRSEREAGLEGFRPRFAPTMNDGIGGREHSPDAEGSHRANHHPTVKPIDLCRWMVRLVTRKGHLVLDPFMGSGSIGCAALQERRRYVGLDLNPEYVEIARARLEHWAPKQVDMFKDREVS